MYLDGEAKLAESGEDFRPVDEAVYRKAVRSIFRRSGFTVDMMETREVRALVDEYARVLNTATRPALENGIIPEAMARKLEGKNAYTFQNIANLVSAMYKNKAEGEKG